MTARHATPRSYAWGTAAITTIAVLTAAVAGCGTGLALFWSGVAYDGTVIVHTLRVFVVLAAIAADLCFMARCGLRLYRSSGQLERAARRSGGAS